MPVRIICEDGGVALRAAEILAEHNIRGSPVEQSFSRGERFPAMPRLPQRVDDLVISEDAFRGSFLLVFLERQGTNEPASFRAATLDDALSSYVLACHRQRALDLSSRHDRSTLERYRDQYSFGRFQNPLPWIVSSPFVMRLSPRRYSNLFAFVTNERGLFFKTGSLSTQRNYWNSSLNGGLALTKKRDSIHEGTFLLHDIFHFSFPDPVYDGTDTRVARCAYIAHRMASEAATMVLADMLAMDDADIGAVNYDPSPRRIYPLYETLNLPASLREKISTLFEANFRYAIKGDDSSFRRHGADHRRLAHFRAKYETYFAVDMTWNASNFDFMAQESRKNSQLRQYYCRLGALTGCQTLSRFVNSIARAGQVSLNDLVSYFLTAIMRAFLYPSSFNELRYVRQAALNFYAGQLIIFYRFAHVAAAAEMRKEALSQIGFISAGRTVRRIERAGRAMDEIIEKFVLLLAHQGHLRPHEVPLYLMHVPHFPPSYYSYDRPVGMQSIAEVGARELGKVVT